VYGEIWGEFNSEKICVLKLTNSIVYVKVARKIKKDQIPVSNIQDIVVSWLHVEKSPMPVPVIDKTGIAEWQLKVSAGREVTVPFSFSVEFPKGIRVSGL